MEDRKVYQHRTNYYGSTVPRKYSYSNAHHGRGIGGAVFESVFMGKESQVREGIEAGSLPDLPWDRSGR